MIMSLSGFLLGLFQRALCPLCLPQNQQWLHLKTNLFQQPLDTFIRAEAKTIQRFFLLHSSHLITNRGENPIIIIQSQPPVHDGELVLVGTVQYSQSHVHHLQVFAPGGGGEELWPSSDIIDDGIMEPWHSGVEWMERKWMLFCQKYYKSYLRMLIEESGRPGFSNSDYIVDLVNQSETPMVGFQFLIRCLLPCTQCKRVGITIRNSQQILFQQT